MQKPLICFYKDNLYFYCDDYQTITSENHESAFDFLNEVEKNFYSEYKIVQLNFDAFHNELSVNKKDFTKSRLIHVFILKKYQIVTNEQLIDIFLINNVDHQKMLNQKFQSQVSKTEFIDKVLSVKTDIANGRFYQLNLTHYFTSHGVKNDDQVYSMWNELSQKIFCPYKALIPINNDYLLCFSPELFLKKEQQHILSQPIKGTIARSHDNANRALITSTKENAELSMIVDLMRNDLNKISSQGQQSEVSFHRQILDTGYVLHTYSEIRTKTEMTLPSILKNTFPAGSISGCPKRESLLKIQEIENYNRDFYTGSIGWWHQDNFILNVAIRSLITNQNESRYYAGCGIVYDSNPEQEWIEYLNKASFLNVE